jgi:hypothetical protein
LLLKASRASRKASAKSKLPQALLPAFQGFNSYLQ